jgi:hypothetical protein
MRNYLAALKRGAPMAAARLVRRERYAWPGGYPLALIMDDGEALCPDCVAAEYPQIARAHQYRHNNGWRPAGYIVLEEGTEICAHCYRVIGVDDADTQPNTDTEED